MSKRCALGKVALSLFTGIIAVATTWGQVSTKSAKTVWDKVYSEDQARRGDTVFAEQCAFCHAADMTGAQDVPALTGPAFLEKWEGKTAGELFEYLTTSMPMTAPGSLSKEQYVDLIAAIFQHNKFPPSDKTELPLDPKAMAEITIRGTDRAERNAEEE